MEKRKLIKKEPSSFRDPSGFVYYSSNKVYRQVNVSYKQEYQLFIDSGLSQKLVDEKLILPFSQEKNPTKTSTDIFTTLSCDKIPFISYPYEWSFGQLKVNKAASLSWPNDHS